MKVLTFTKYLKNNESPTLLISETPKSKINNNEILIEVKATTLCPHDFQVLAGKYRVFTGLLAPTQSKAHLGIEFSGIVTEMGNNVSNFNIGDKVFGANPVLTGAKAMSQYVVSRPSYLSLIPQGMGFEEAASWVYSGVTAFKAIHNIAKVKNSSRALLIGASGGVGVLLLQLLKQLYVDVTAVGRADHFENLKLLGANSFIDYKKENLLNLTKKFDAIFDTTGLYGMYSLKKLLCKNGFFLSLNENLYGQHILANFIDPYYKRGIPLVSSIKHQDLKNLCQLYELNKLIPVIGNKINLDTRINDNLQFSIKSSVFGKTTVSIQ